MLYRVIDDNGTKKREPLTGIGYGMPLGAVVILANNTILPDGYLLCDGSTFDETVYPALYTYLGTDTLPVYQTSSGDYKAIKATPAGSGDISDVGALITRNASYSTDETLTGGTWIDDKPIYRKVFTWPNVGLASGWNNVIEITNDFNPETLVNARWLTTTSGVGVSYGFFRIYNGYIQFYSPGVTWEASGAILEYTKA